MNAMIDTLKFARSFQEAGFEARQAEALALALAEASSQGREDLATKADLRHLETQLETKFEAGLNQVRLEVKASIAEVKSQVADVKADMVRWLIGSQAVLLMTLVALANFTRVFD